MNTHSRAHCSPGARLCEQWGHGCVNNGARLCASARLCKGLPVIIILHVYIIIYTCIHNYLACLHKQVHMYKYLSGHVYMIRYINVADESAALLLSLMPNCNKNEISWHNWYNRNDAMLILLEMLHTCGIMHTLRGCKFEKKAPMPRDVSSQMWPSLQWQKLV